MLNSVIIEDAIDKIISTENNSITFSLAVVRGKWEVSHFKVKISYRLAKSSDFKKGREIRVCGCLRELQGDLFISAECLEFKKTFNPLLDLDEI